MSVNKITTAPQPIDEVNKINEIIDGLGNKADDSDVVHNTGTENIAGEKTFTGPIGMLRSSPAISMKNEDVTKGTNPSAASAWVVAFGDDESSASAHRLGAIGSAIATNGLVSASIRAYKNAAGVTDNAAIVVYYPTSGDPYTSAPASIETDSIVTTTSLSRGSGNIAVGFGNTLKITTKEISLTANSDTTFNYGITFGATPTVLLSRRTNTSATGTAYPAWVRGSTGTSSCKIYSNVTGTCMAMAIGY